MLSRFDYRIDCFPLGGGTLCCLPRTDEPGAEGCRQAGREPGLRNEVVGPDQQKHGAPSLLDVRGALGAAPGALATEGTPRSAGSGGCRFLWIWLRRYSGEAIEASCERV